MMKLEPQLSVVSSGPQSAPLPTDPLLDTEPTEPIPDDIAVLAEAAPVTADEAAPPPALPPRRTTMPSTTPVARDAPTESRPPAPLPPSLSGSQGGEGLYIDILPMKIEGKQQQRLLLNPFADAFGEQESATDEYGALGHAIPRIHTLQGPASPSAVRHNDILVRYRLNGFAVLHSLHVGEAAPVLPPRRSTGASRPAMPLPPKPN